MLIHVGSPELVIRQIAKGDIDEIDAVNYYNKLRKEKVNKSDYKFYMESYNIFFKLLDKKHLLRNYKALPKRRVNTKS